MKSPQSSSVFASVIPPCLLYTSLVSNEWNTYRQEQLISSYDSQVAEKAEAGEIDYTAQWDAARAYNEELLPSIPVSYTHLSAGEPSVSRTEYREH